MNYFSNIIGQDRAIKMLEKAINNNTISHAYLFTGAAGVGKMLSAVAFAHTIIHQADKDAALYFKEGLHPDLLIIKKLEKRTLISKEQISKEMEPWLALKPYRASHRVVIIQDCHLMSLEAANALLKTLEEPPEYGVIILVSDENNLLETIISRCQLIRFFSVNDIEIEKFLIKRGFDQDVSYRASRLGQGSISTALCFAEEKGFQKVWNMAGTIIKDLARGQLIEVFKAAEKMERDPLLLINMIETILRDICIYQETKKEEFMYIPENVEFARLIKGINSKPIMKALNEISSLKTYYRRNVNPLVISTNISYEVWEALQ